MGAPLFSNIRQMAPGPFFTDLALDIILRPWFDATAVRFLCGLYYPASRYWVLAQDDDAAFWALAERSKGGLAAQALFKSAMVKTKGLRRRLDDADRVWELAFFADQSTGKDLLSIEQDRHDAAHRLMAARAFFVPALLTRVPRPVRWSVEAPAQVAQRHGARLTGREPAFPVPGPVKGRLSPWIERNGIREAWLRFPSRGGDATAHLFQPLDWRPEKGTVVYAHGFAVESEYWKDNRDSLVRLTDQGVRVIRLEAPFHGRRRLHGYGGGEPILAFGPGGLLDFFHAQVCELGGLIAWAREQGKGPVGLAGVSLGALTSQLVLSHCEAWPREARPDATLLVTASASVEAVTFQGSLAGGLGAPQALRTAGWSRDAVSHWSPLFDPGPACHRPDRVVLALGQVDTVTPYAQGRALAKLWDVPEANLYEEGRGHFTTYLGLAQDQSPLARFLSLLNGG